jgi:hypothetical protein
MLHKKKDNLFSLVTTLTTKLGFSFLRMTTLRAKLVIESIAMRNVLLGRRRYHVRIGRSLIGSFRQWGYLLRTRLRGNIIEHFSHLMFLTKSI